MLKARVSVNGASIQPRHSSSPTNNVVSKMTKVNSNFGPASSGNPLSVSTFGAPAFSTLFQGIVPEHNETSLLQYYRDCYYYDSVGGATVDLSASFPFSDWSLTGLDTEDLDVFNESLSRLHFRSLFQEISNSYLVDGAFIGTLIYDSDSKTFQDILIHDTANSAVTFQPFHSLDPVITVNTAPALSQVMNSNSPYIDNLLASYPKAILDKYLQGNVVLDPLTTIYVPRRGLRDKTHVSYLKRLLPVYMLEKILFRGTLTEAHKRQRATSHIKAGDDTWTPTDSELSSILGEFQRTELDPLGAWIITRQGVEVNEVRNGGEFWKWTDNIDVLTPFKLRALGISEAFLSGDASYATAEAAISVFLESMDAYRQFLTYKVFTSKLFPLIGVLHNMYRDPTKARTGGNIGDILYNIHNTKNLKLPTVRWFKSLNAKDTDSQWDMLEKLSEKGFTIPLKMWSAAASIDIGSLLRDLEEDQLIRDSIEKITGVAPGEGEGSTSEDQFSSEIQSRTKPLPGAGLPLRMANSRETSRRVPLLNRKFGEVNPGRVSKSGKKLHASMSEQADQKRSHEYIVRAMKNLEDPHYRASLRKKVQSKVGSNLNLFM